MLCKCRIIVRVGNVVIGVLVSEFKVCTHVI